MKGKGKTPQYAIRLVILIVVTGSIFFGGLRLFVPDGSKLTGSYDAESLLYIAAAPVAFRGSDSCGTADCHNLLFTQWSTGAHGAKKEQSKCEVCHGPQGEHPGKVVKMPKVRGGGDIVELCLTCHRKMKARSTTGQPQISPQEHPYPHEERLLCTQCHDPHSPRLGAPKTTTEIAENSADSEKKDGTTEGESIAESCFTCHGTLGRGGFAPVLASQPYEALKDKLTKFRSGEVTGTLMNGIAKPLKDEEIDAFAHYFTALP